MSIYVLAVFVLGTVKFSSPWNFRFSNIHGQLQKSHWQKFQIVIRKYKFDDYIGEKYSYMSISGLTYTLTVYH